jgi:hypothetical protein
MQTLNFVIRFVLELCAVAALGYWGFVTGEGLAARLLLGLGAPLLAAVAWGAFVAPKARWPAKEPWRLLVEVMVFGAAAAGLVAVGQSVMALALIVVYAINRFILVRLGAMDNF